MLEALSATVTKVGSGFSQKENSYEASIGIAQKTIGHMDLGFQTLFFYSQPPITTSISL